MIPRSKPIQRRKPLRTKRRKQREGRLVGKAMTALRELVWERDGPNCVRCQRLMVKYPQSVLQENGYHLAHIVPRSLGGLDTASNTEAVCGFCHLVLEHTKGVRPERKRSYGNK